MKQEYDKIKDTGPSLVGTSLSGVGNCLEKMIAYRESTNVRRRVPYNHATRVTFAIRQFVSALDIGHSGETPLLVGLRPNLRCAWKDTLRDCVLNQLLKFRTGNTPSCFIERIADRFSYTNS